MSTSPAEKQQRLRWACRRGMLELDLILNPFCEKIFPTLDLFEQKQFEYLLTCTDQELFAWLVLQEEPSDHALIKMVRRVRACA